MIIKELMILFIAVLALSGCKMEPADTTSVEKSGILQGKEEPDSQKVSGHHPVIIRQGNEGISLYELIVSEMTYSKENGCIFGDGARLSNILMELADDLPLVAWCDDVEVRIPEELGLYYIEIFDERYEEVNRFFPESETDNDGLTSSEICMNYMKELPRGTYYVSIAVVEEGEYVESENRNEYTVYEYAFRFDKNIPPYTYSKEDIYMKEICEYFCGLAEDEREGQISHAVAEGKGTDIIYIPVPVIMKAETAGDKVFIYGRFWDMWYALDETNLYCISVGENAGRLEMTREEGAFQVTGFEKIGDGSYYVEDWKHLCGDDKELYERFFTKEEREDRRETIRREMILQYVQDNGLDIESYQDFGWEPVRLRERDGGVEESEADTWNEAYKSYLSDFNGGSRYDYFHYSWRDLDSNGIPELIIEETKEDDGSLTVYSYDGNVVKIGSYSNPKIGVAALQFSSNPEFPGLFTLWWGGGVEHYGYLTVEDSKLMHVDLWYIDHLNENEIEVSDDKALIIESKKVEATDNFLEMYPIDVTGIGEL